MKCTFCQPRLVKGQLPGCVEICPAEALTFGQRRNLLKIARERIGLFPDRYIDHIYGETEDGRTAWLTISGVPFRDLGMREDLGTTPAPELTKGALERGARRGRHVARAADRGLRHQPAPGQDRPRGKAAAVAAAVAQAQAEAKAKLTEAMAKAEKDKKAAIDKEVKKALEEAAKAQPSAAAPAAAPEKKPS